MEAHLKYSRLAEPTWLALPCVTYRFSIQPLLQPQDFSELLLRLIDCSVHWCAVEPSPCSVSDSCGEAKVGEDKL